MKNRWVGSFVLVSFSVMLFSSRADAQIMRRQQARRMTQVTILPQAPVAARIQPSPMNQVPGRWQTNRPMISSGFEMPTKPLFLGGYAGRNYGHGIRQAYVPVAPGSVEGELRTIELKPLR